MEGDAKAVREHFAAAKPRSKVLVLTLDRASKTNFHQQPLALHRDKSEGVDKRHRVRAAADR